jgi:hypothetical protein
VVAVRVRPFGYSRAVESGYTSIPYVRQFEQTFPNSSHSISYFTGTSGDPTWRSEALVHGRYTVTMQMPVRFNTLRNRIASFDEPRFQLVEIQSVSALPGGQTSLSSGGTQLNFGPREWQHIVDGGGELESLGVHIDTDRPVTGLKDHWRRTNP